jgi:RimJ/RimL family protein N-acetyltransferase
MTRVTLRAMTDADLELLTGGESEYDDWGPRQQRQTLPGASLDENGGYIIDADGEVAGDVSWHWTAGGPGVGSRYPNIGIWLRPDYRGRGIGTAAQAQLAENFFTYTVVNRVEASTDVTNLAEQRALERAGFQRDGVVRGSQWRLGAYHDMCLYSILRADTKAGAQ